MFIVLVAMLVLNAAVFGAVNDAGDSDNCLVF